MQSQGSRPIVVSAAVVSVAAPELALLVIPEPALLVIPESLELAVHGHSSMHSTSTGTQLVPQLASYVIPSTPQTGT
jgi:hypothetical protein